MNEKFLKWLQEQEYAHSYPMDAGWATYKVAINIRGVYTAPWPWHFVLKTSKHERNNRL